MHTIKITANLLFEYQCTSSKFIRLPNRIEKIDSVARIESNRIKTFFSPNCNARSPGGVGAFLLRGRLARRVSHRLVRVEPVPAQDAADEVCTTTATAAAAGAGREVVGQSQSGRRAARVSVVVKKVKFSHTRYRALGPELIPVYRQSARR